MSWYFVTDFIIKQAGISNFDHIYDIKKKLGGCKAIFGSTKFGQKMDISKNYGNNKE